jgi:hypothetical protein
VAQNVRSASLAWQASQVAAAPPLVTVRVPQLRVVVLAAAAVVQS